MAVWTGSRLRQTLSRPGWRAGLLRSIVTPCSDIPGRLTGRRMAVGGMAAAGQEMAAPAHPAATDGARTCPGMAGNAGGEPWQEEMMADDRWVPRGEPDGLRPAVPVLAHPPLPRSDGCPRPGGT